MLHIEHPVRNATRVEHAMPIAMDATLFVALELSLSSWVVVASAPGEDKASKHGLAACDGPGLLALLDRLRQRAATRCRRPVAVVVMQEAGRDGFWVHRLLEAHGVRSFVVDPSSIAVSCWYAGPWSAHVARTDCRRGGLGQGASIVRQWSRLGHDDSITGRSANGAMPYRQRMAAVRLRRALPAGLMPKRRHASRAAASWSAAVGVSQADPASRPWRGTWTLPTSIQHVRPAHCLA